MAELTVSAISKSGIVDYTASLSAADAAGDSVRSAGGIFIVLENGDASSHTLTVTRPSATAICDDLGSLAVEDITFTVGAGDTGFLSIPLGYSAAGGNFSWSYDAVTSVNVGVFSIAP